MSKPPALGKRQFPARISMAKLAASMLLVRTFRTERSLIRGKRKPPRNTAIFTIEFEVDSLLKTLRY
jgi:hypothetical protein